MDKLKPSVIFEGYYNPDLNYLGLIHKNDIRCFNRPQMSKDAELLLEKEQYFINESRHIDFTFCEVINYLKLMISSFKEDNKNKFPNHYNPTEQLEFDNLYFSGYAYNDVVHNVFESEESSAQHCIYLYPFYDSTAEFAYLIDKMALPISYETESNWKSIPIVIAINLLYMTNSKCIAGTLYHEFNHVLKMYVIRHGTLIDSTDGHSGAFQFLTDNKYSFLKTANNLLYLKISNFLYEISKTENDAMIQSIYGAIEEYSDEEIKQILNGSKDEIRMVYELDKFDICDLRYKTVTDRYDKLKDIKNNIFTWLVIGNRFQECLFDKPYSIYFDISYVRDFFFDNVEKDTDTIDKITKDIIYIKALVEKHIRKYKKKVESVTRDCLIERGFIDGTVNRGDFVYYDDVDLTNNRVKHKKANIHDIYDKQTLKKFKDMLPKK